MNTIRVRQSKPRLKKIEFMERIVEGREVLRSASGVSKYGSGSYQLLKGKSDYKLQAAHTKLGRRDLHASGIGSDKTEAIDAFRADALAKGWPSKLVAMICDGAEGAPDFA